MKNWFNGILARPESEPKTPLGARLREFRRKVGDPDRDAMAQRLGVSKNSLASYERGETEPSASALEAYRKHYGANLTWLVSGEGHMFRDPSKVPVKPMEVDPKIVQRLVDTMEQVEEALRPSYVSPRDLPKPERTIRYYPSVRVSAGGGLVPLHPFAPGVDLGLEDLVGLFGLEIRDMAIFRIDGDSMLPALAAGDMVVVDTSDQETDEGLIYVVELEGELFAKRAHWKAGALTWMSDNPAFAPIPVARDMLADLKVYGRVVWLWREVL